MRATKNRPEIEPSVIVFKPRGAQVRRRVAAGLLAAAVFALTAVVVWEASRSAVVPRPKPPQGATIPAGWEECTNAQRGYSIAYPGDWYTTDVFDGTPDPANACQWFSPEPFGPDGNVVPEGWGYPLEVAIRGPFDDALARTRTPRPSTSSSRSRFWSTATAPCGWSTRPTTMCGGERAALRVRDRARRRNDADRAHDADSGRGGRVRGQQGRGGSRGGHAGVPGGLLGGDLARPGSSVRGYPPEREAAGPTGLLPLPAPYLRPRQARGAVGAGGGRGRAGPDLSGLPTRPPRLAGEPGSVRGLRLHPLVRHPGRCGVPSVRACRWWWCGRLAQLEERRPYKAKDGGSSPSAPTGKEPGQRPYSPCRSLPPICIRTDLHHMAGRSSRSKESRDRTCRTGWY